MDFTASRAFPRAPSLVRLSPTDWTDRELLARMLERDGLAWREFDTRFGRLIFRCIHRVVARFRAGLGSEDVQEIHAQLMYELTARDMKKLRAFQPERGNKLGSWIGMLATNAAWDHLRRASRQPPSSEVQDATDLRSEGESPFEETVRREHVALVAETLAEFSDKDREFVVLYFMEGLTPEAVAEKMEISVKTVYSKKHKIRCRLEHALSERLQSAPLMDC